MLLVACRGDNTGRYRSHSMVQLQRQPPSSERPQPWPQVQLEEGRMVLEWHRVREQPGLAQSWEHQRERHLK